MATSGAVAAPPHPLEPLSVIEVERAAAACRAKAAAVALPRLRFNTLTLEEPPKAQLLDWQQAGSVPGQLPRRAFCILQAPPEFPILEALVDLALPAAGADAVVSWTKVAGDKLDGQPLATPDDCLEAEAIARKDPRVLEMLAERGITEQAKVACDPWAIHDCPPEWRGRRLMQVFMYYKACPDDNEYAHPLDLCPVVDIFTGEVVHIDHYEVAPPTPMRPANYHQRLLDRPFRPPPRPLNITQPQGPDFVVEGHRVMWQNWDLRLGFNGREGLVLYDVVYHDPVQRRRRPVLHRAAISEMAVPYSDPRTPYNRKCALDAGDYGLGFAANSLVNGCDCSGHVVYFDGVVNNAAGEAVVIPNAICLHEEDHGLLWKHVDYRTGYAEVRRGRRLVISFIMTAVNYEYCFYWQLYQDGTVACEIKLTGILSTSPLSPGEDPGAPSHGTLIGGGINAAHHQHLFCARLDPAVDDERGGRGLELSEVDAVPGPPTSATNPSGNAFTFTETPLASAGMTRRQAAPERNRVWRVANPSKRHPHSNKAVAYHLMPAQGPLLLAQPDSAIARRAEFTTAALWATTHADGQLYPAGTYVYNSTNDTGLGVWAKEDKPLDDPVLWYTFGLTHLVRAEDWPVMPCDTTGFMFKPHGFFDCNPALDVPPSTPAVSEAAAGCNGPLCKL